MNHSHPNYYCFALACLLAGVSLGGCGGSGADGSSQSLASTSPAPSGRIVLMIAWPSATSRVIPMATTDIVVQVVSNSGVFDNNGTHTQTVDVSRGMTNVTIPDVPAGSCTVQASAYFKNTGGTEVLLATVVAAQSVTVTAGADTPVVLTFAAALTNSTAALSATIQKVLNADGSSVTPTDPVATPQPIPTTVFGFTDLVDGAVYAIAVNVALLSTPNTTLPLPSSAFTITGANEFGAVFLTPVTALGQSLTSPEIGNVAYFKVTLAGGGGKINASLSSDYSAPGLNVTGTFTLTRSPPAAP